LRDPPAGCRFNPRCPHCTPENAGLFLRQTTEPPLLQEIEPSHYVACHLVEEGAA
jgi:ABC-type dipeptide/oligopeptide/nickel transport system ATPase component